VTVPSSRGRACQVRRPGGRSAPNPTCARVSNFSPAATLTAVCRSRLLVERSCDQYASTHSHRAAARGIEQPARSGANQTARRRCPRWWDSPRTGRQRPLARWTTRILFTKSRRSPGS